MKAILIFLVVFGHMIIGAEDNGHTVRGIEYYIYIFHIPAFVLVSGFFSKGYIKKLKNTGRLQLNKIFGYVFLCLALNFSIWLVAFIFKAKPIIDHDFLCMDSAPWYMIAMAMWLLILPVFAQLERKTSILLSFAVGIFVPAMGDLSNLFSLGRVINFLPFFVIGYWLNGEDIKRIKRRRGIKIAAALFLIVVAAAVMNNVGAVGHYSGFLWESSGYSAIPLRRLYYIPLKCGYYLLALLMTFSVMVLCPSRNCFLSYLGSKTLGIYIGHRILRDVLRDLGVIEFFSATEYSKLIFFFIASIMITLLFSGKRINKLVNLPFRIMR